MGSDDDWALAEGALERVVKASGLPYHRAEGEAVFYGPKIDIKLTDAIGRPWQCATIQFDFNLPRRFDVNYVGSDGQEHQVFMIHRALLGSMERSSSRNSWRKWLPSPKQGSSILATIRSRSRRLLTPRRNATGVLDKRVPPRSPAEGIADGRTVRNGRIVRPHSFDPPASLPYPTPR